MRDSLLFTENTGKGGLYSLVIAEILVRERLVGQGLFHAMDVKRVPSPNIDI